MQGKTYGEDYRLLRWSMVTDYDFTEKEVVDRHQSEAREGGRSLMHKLFYRASCWNACNRHSNGYNDV